MTSYFYDSYALIEALKGTAHYRQFFENVRGSTSKIQLMEAYYYALSNRGVEAADAAYDYFLPMCVELPDASIREAMKMRLESKRAGKNISYADAIGYVRAKELNAVFLTGDSAFKDMENVEFVR